MANMTRNNFLLDRCEAWKEVTKQSLFTMS